MQRLFIIGMAGVVTLALLLGAFLFIAIWPFIDIIGRVAAGVVITALICAAVLLVSFTYNRVVNWSIKRRLVVAGEVVVYLNRDNTYMHFSAEHVSAGVIQPPAMIVNDQEDTQRILELYEKGLSRRSIAKSLDIPYNRVQTLLAGKV